MAIFWTALWAAHSWWGLRRAGWGELASATMFATLVLAVAVFMIRGGSDEAPTSFAQPPYATATLTPDPCTTPAAPTPTPDELDQIINKVIATELARPTPSPANTFEALAATVLAEVMAQLPPPACE
ncbi:MAG TPA: hypothetical protein VNM91_01095 [Dehalococcoidia bacterium]|nr:hypothetical protein [Dehalococcoidia bacterium]